MAVAEKKRPLSSDKSFGLSSKRNKKRDHMVFSFDLRKCVVKTLNEGTSLKRIERLRGILRTIVLCLCVYTFF